MNLTLPRPGSTGGDKPHLPGVLIDLCLLAAHNPGHPVGHAAAAGGVGVQGRGEGGGGGGWGRDVGHAPHCAEPRVVDGEVGVEADGHGVARAGDARAVGWVEKRASAESLAVGSMRDLHIVVAAAGVGFKFKSFKSNVDHESFLCLQLPLLK